VRASGVLYVVATPIGNLGDLSPRARETLAGVELIAAEDTRHTGQLLRRMGIDRPLQSLHEHNERDRAAGLVARLLAGARIALVSDAGTPLVSDPGFHLVRAARAAGVPVVPLPGPCAAIAALSVSGIATDRFCFEGFLPARRGERRERLAALAAEPRTLVFFEAPHRIRELLADLVDCFGADREAALARELTKAHETHYSGRLGELVARLADDDNVERGELVLVVAGHVAAADAGGDDTVALDRALVPLLRALPVSQAADLAAEITATKPNRAYARALELKRGGGADEA
jgi:16S rRNA (cytidine1402-2'-O)-methyltransferase